MPCLHVHVCPHPRPLAVLQNGPRLTAAHPAHGQQQRHDLQQVLVDAGVAQGTVLRKQRHAGRMRLFVHLLLSLR